MFRDKKLRSGILVSLLLAFAVVVTILLYADASRLLQALLHFHWEILPLILGLTLCNYALRFVKWHFYLHLLAIPLKLWPSLLIFLAGLSMAITPGKVGELLKSYLLKERTGTAIRKTAPIIVAERLTDGIAMLLLAGVGLMQYRFGWQILLILFIGGLGGIIIIQNRKLSLALLRHGERIPLVSPIVHWLRDFYESAFLLLRWQPLCLAVLLGVISWTGECLALYFVYLGSGVSTGGDLLLKSIFILAVSSLVGSASTLPGGLGTTDGSIVGLTQFLVTASATIAGAATILIRFCTLWFGLFLGVIALILYRTTQAGNTKNGLAEVTHTK
ncbi:uncharacterized protein (TIRG00374 family) [Thermosporothrix hazakensis]|uniref:Uncharacterized protein (TIRG00374 family) n=1 Tax=Thermosporothrix hazakensis TaxID=644383 RepID=A0A326U9H4_THEHA|nr:lysylphosphatidylglycerol synthase transmembrane domain-containing protein [Thermosporothrix hazakensis]PZW32856.1 uncharacterized protein (TIRG00374 family) [Thermosporothrix hazakensis]GCE48887.1 TIGR00374 family protein [Thermosporothrix hazakensis]